MKKKRKKKVKRVKMIGLTSGALRGWSSIGLILSTTGSMRELVDGLPQLAI